MLIINIIIKYYKMDSNDFIQPNDPFIKYINDVVQQTFPKLIKHDQEYLINGLIRLINVISIMFGWDLNPNSKEIYQYQLTQNNSMDLQGLLNLILPYIEDEKKKYLEKFEDMSMYTINGKYYFTNTQYNRCIRYLDQNSEKLTKINTVERPYKEYYIDQNINLLIYSIIMSSHKLYVNWIDIFPVSMNEYTSSQLYERTRNKLIIINDARTVKSLDRDLSPGLTMSTIYNCISNHLFHEVKNTKWLIYDFIDGDTLIPGFVLLQKLIPLKTIIDNVHWNNLNQLSQNEFQQMFQNMVNNSSSNNNAIVINIYYFFQKYYSLSENLIKTGVLIPVIQILDNTLDSDNDEDDDTDRDNYDLNNKIDQVKNVLLTLPIEYIYLFLLEQLNSFKNTWYYYRIQNNNYILFQESNLFLTLKNIFNYSKSLVYFSDPDNNYINMPKHYNSLYYIMKLMFYLRIIDYEYIESIESTDNFININPTLRDGEIRTWFNLNKYIERIYSQNSDDKVRINNWIHNNAHEKIPDIIFESLIYHGLLSKFVPNKSLTDESIISNITGSDDDIRNRYKRYRIKSYFDTNSSDLTNSYYYLTSKTYDKKYFDYLTSDQFNQRWTFTYAMNWISQISFFHHYINNRVLYITGGTGIGKSTQTPKLFLYALRMLDYNPKGKVIMTEPRIPPTRGNAEQISLELGVPINELNSNYNKYIPSNNFNVQYQYQGSSHINKSTEYYLRLVTDGLFFEQLINNPFLTVSKNVNNKIIYTANNIYDIVIVDEAHEHNTNMDMILTLTRTALYLNNSIKLVIISATMEDDEPIYRRYYREINDNLMYPLNFVNQKYKLDRINVDRRIHISPPGQSTIYSIVDHYLTPSEYKSVTKDNYVTYTINKVLQIVKTTRNGDILVFLTGQKDINKTVEQINTATPPDVICFPYYSDLPDEQKDFILNLDKRLPLLTASKKDLFVSANNNTINSNKNSVPIGTYKRAIIVATNIAEASITLSTLKYVIDPGYAKVRIYNPLKEESFDVVRLISQSSATQRRGRVGRVSDGVVYHLYDRDALINNRTNYKIAEDDYRDILIRLFKDKTYHYPIINVLDNVIHPLIQPAFPTNDVKATLSSVFIGIEPIIDIIQKQYMYIPQMKFFNTLIQYQGIENKSMLLEPKPYIFNQESYLESFHDDYHFYYSWPFYYKFYEVTRSGYDYAQINDGLLLFYLIHPDENIIIRNPLTGFLDHIQIKDESYRLYYEQINFNTSSNSLTEVAFPKIDLGLHYFYHNLLLVPIPPNSASAININNIDELSWSQQYKNLIPLAYNGNFTVIRTKLSIELNALRRELNDRDILRNWKNLLWYMYALNYNIESDVLALMIMMNTLPDMTNFIDTNTKIDIHRFLRIHQTSKGDFYFAYKILRQIKAILNIKDTPDDFYQQILIEKNNFDAIKNKYLTNPESLSYDQFIQIDRLFKSSQLNSTNDFYQYRMGLNTNINDSDMNTNISHKIKIYCQDNYLSYDNISKFVNNYSRSLNSIELLQWKILQEATLDSIKDSTKDPIKDPITWIKTNVKFNIASFTNPNDKFSLIRETYLRSAGSKVAIYYQNNNYYSLASCQVISYPISRYININVFNSQSKYIVYHQIESIESNESDNVSIMKWIMPINLQWIIEVLPEYFLRLREDEICYDISLESTIKSLIADYLKDLNNMYDQTYYFKFAEMINDPLLRNYLNSQWLSADNINYK